MLKTRLSLEVSPNPNPKVIRLFDTSFYCNGETVSNYLVEVLPVNKSKWAAFHVQKGFSLVLNASALGYGSVNGAEDLMDLPDGIYEIKQSYKPNLFTVNHFYHFRVTELARKVLSERVKLHKKQCAISPEEYQKNIAKLRDIDEYVQSAKWTVEECHEKKSGLEMYKWAEKLLEQYSNECGC